MRAVSSDKHHEARGLFLPPSDAGLATEVLAHFVDAASDRFDQRLARMPLDDDQRRELKFWQRQSLAALGHYAAVAIPGAMAAVAAGRGDALESVEAAERIWDTASTATTTASGIQEPHQSISTLEQRRLVVAAKLACAGAS